MNRTPLAAAAAACMLSLTLTACGSSKEDSGSSGMQTIRITNPANVSNAALHIAIDKGYFKAEGIKVQADVDLGAGSDTEAVIGGQVDMAWSNVVGALSPFSEGIPLRMVALTDYAVPNYLQVLVPDKSPAKSLADLKGKTIAVLSPKTVCILAVQTALKAQGLDPNSIKFTTVPPQDQPTVLSAGQVNATCSSDPTRTKMMEKLKVRPVFDTADSPLGKFVIGGYIVSEKYAASHKALLDKFKTALTKATKDANTDPSTVRKELGGYAELPTELADKVTITKYSDNLVDKAAVQELADKMTEYKMASGTIDVAKFLGAS